MIQRKPGRNTLAIILQALLVLYVASYLVIRFCSLRLPHGSPGAHVIVLGMSEADYKARATTGLILGTHAATRRISFLRVLYSPLRRADRWITGIII